MGLKRGAWIAPAQACASPRGEGRRVWIVPTLVTAEHVGQAETPAEPSPWLTLAAVCPLTLPPAARARAAGTGATAGWELR
jgi:hypothetical protein